MLQSSKRKRLIYDNLKYLAILLVPMALYAVFFLFPNLQVFYYSVLEWDTPSDIRTFVGLQNFFDVLFVDPMFTKALLNTLLYSFLLIIFGTVTGLVLSVALSKTKLINNIFRSVFFAPSVLCPIAVGLMWRIGVYDPVIGVVNTALKVLGLGSLARTWLAEPVISVAAIVLVHIWAFMGFSLIMYLSGLQNIPAELYESSRIEGASGPQTFFRITLPMLRETSGVVVLLAIINGFTSFDYVYVLTGGGSNGSSEVLATLLYKQMFTYHRPGRSAATAILLLVIILIISLVQNAVLNRKSDS